MIWVIESVFNYQPPRLPPPPPELLPPPPPELPRLPPELMVPPLDLDGEELRVVDDLVGVLLLVLTRVFVLLRVFILEFGFTRVLGLYLLFLVLIEFLVDRRLLSVRLALLRSTVLLNSEFGLIELPDLLPTF